MDSLPAGDEERRGVSRSAVAQEVLHFGVSGMHLCVPLDYVSKVLPLMSLQPVPGGASYLRGLLNLHGASIPVIDLAERLGHKSVQAYTLDTPILLCSSGERRVGLIISEVRDVRSIENKERQMTEVLKDGNLPFLAVFNTQYGLSLMLDIQRVLDMGVSDDGNELHVDHETLMQQLS